MKQIIEVGLACIHRDGRYLIAKQQPERGGLWEFPGGKLEPRESIEDCVKREVLEEIGVAVAVEPPFIKVQREISDKLLELNFCLCQIKAGEPSALQHSELCWVSSEAFDDYRFPEPNTAALNRLKSLS